MRRNRSILVAAWAVALACGDSGGAKDGSTGSDGGDGVDGDDGADADGTDVTDDCAPCDGWFTVEAIADLDALSSCSSISGNLVIESVDGLETVDLPCLESVEGWLTIRDNADLIDLDGLSTLASVGCHALVGENPNLQDVAGLSSLRSVGAADPSRCDDAGQGVLVVRNAALQRLSGLGPGLAVVGRISVLGNDSLSMVADLDATARGLTISDNDALTVVERITLERGRPTGWGLRISDNDALAAVELNVAGTSPIGVVEISDNPALETVELGVEATVLNDGLIIEDNASLQRVTLSTSLSRLDGGLRVHGNPRLSALPDLTGVASTVWVQLGSNGALANLDALSALQRIEGLLLVEDHATLTDISGLSALQSVGELAAFVDNPLLCEDHIWATLGAVTIDSGEELQSFGNGASCE